MKHRLVALFSFAILAGFLGILAGYVARWDLSVMVIITIALAGWDFFQSLRLNRKPFL